MKKLEIVISLFIFLFLLGKAEAQNIKVLPPNDSIIYGLINKSIEINYDIIKARRNVRYNSYLEMGGEKSGADEPDTIFHLYLIDYVFEASDKFSDYDLQNMINVEILREYMPKIAYVLNFDSIHTALSKLQIKEWNCELIRLIKCMTREECTEAEAADRSIKMFPPNEVSKIKDNRKRYKKAKELGITQISYTIQFAYPYAFEYNGEIYGVAFMEFYAFNYFESGHNHKMTELYKKEGKEWILLDKKKHRGLLAL